MQAATNRVMCASRRLDLRFDDAGKERAFQKASERRLVFLFCLGEVAQLAFFFMSLLAPDEDSSDGKYLVARAITLGAYFLVPVCNITFLIMGASWLRCHGCCECCSCFNWEAVVAIWYAVRIVAYPWTQPWITATMCGFDPDDVWNKDTRSNEGHALLGVDFACTALCLFFPIRMCWKWIPPVSATLSMCACLVVVGSPFPEAVAGRACTICVLSLMALWGASQSEQVSRLKFIAEAQVGRKSRELELQHVSNARILNALTDSLICLGPDFRISEHDLRFTALLLCMNQDSIVGRNFCEYLATDEDRRCFIEALTERVAGNSEDEASTKTGAEQGLVHVTLRDRNGRTFRVYAYHANRFNSEGECGHTVAIVEAQERDFSVAEAGVLPMEILPEYLPPEDQQSSSGSDLSESAAGRHEAEVAIWVDTEAPNFPILKCSAGFTIFGPMSPCTPFLDLVVEHKNNSKLKVEEWFWNTLETAVENMDDAVHSCENRQVRLRLLNQSHGSIEFSTICSIDIQAAVPEDLPTPNAARLVFHDIRCTWRRSGVMPTRSNMLRSHTLRSNAQSCLLQL